MDDELDRQIADEEAKLRLLEEAAAARRERVNKLKELKKLKEAVDALQREDAFDAILAAKLGSTAAPAAAGQPPRAPDPFDDGPSRFELTAPPATTSQPEASLNPKAAWPFPTKAAPGPAQPSKRQVHRRGEVKNALLAVLAPTPKHLNVIMAEAAKLGYELTYDRIRTQLWSYKSDGLVDNPDKGFYCLTKEGEAYVERLKGESPVGAGLSGATSSASDLV